MSAHRAHPIRAEHFERWLALRDAASHELLNAESAAGMMEHAECIGHGLQLWLGLLDRPNTRTLGIARVGRASRWGRLPCSCPR